MFGNHPRQQCKEAINQGILFQNFGNAVIVSCYPTEEDNEPKDIKWPSGNQSADNQTKKTGGWWDGRQQTDNGQLGGRPRVYCSYDKESDSFPQYFLYLAAALLALIIHTEFGLFELSWSFSIWLEALAIIPQLYMLQKIKEVIKLTKFISNQINENQNKQKKVENLTSNYAAALGFYRFFYILSWIYRFYFDDWWCWTSVLGGLTQTVIYGDFLYYYILSRKMGSPMTLGV